LGEAGVDDGVGEFDEAAYAEGLGGFDDVDEVVGQGGAAVGGGFGGADVHAAVDLHGVDGEDVGVEGLGEVEGGRALADGGGADDEDEFGWGHGCCPGVISGFSMLSRGRG